MFGIDETIKRRWGRKIQALGIYRDVVHSNNFVKVSGLQWISLIVLTPIWWVQQILALPFMTALSPFQRYYKQVERQPKTMLDRILQMLKQLKRWLPSQDVIGVGDGNYTDIPVH